MTTEKDVKIHVKGLKKSFGHVHVLKGIDAEIKAGEVICVIGPSGSGKSTFLRCLNRLEDPTDGRIIFAGEDLMDPKTDIDMHRQKMGMVFQHFNLFPHKTIMENITLAPVRLKLMKSEEAKEEALRLLKLVNLEEKADAYPGQLSGGQKQRLSIARALARKPEILVFDDSFSALDYATDAKLRAGLEKSLPNTTKIIVAQRIGTIRNADRIIVLDKGEEVGSGTHDELMRSCEVYRQIAKSQLSEKELGLNGNGEGAAI